MVRLLLWIIYASNLLAYGKMLDQAPQIVCDHRFTKKNKTSLNGTDSAIDKQYQQIQCLTHNCNFSNHLEFDIQNYSQFCITWTPIGDERLYQVKYALQRMHSIMSPPFYINFQLQQNSSKIRRDVTAHCRYQEVELQRIYLSVQPCDCSKQSAPPTLTLCPQSTISTVARIQTDPSITLTDNTSKSSSMTDQNIAIITAALFLGICAIIVVCLYQAVTCKKGQVTDSQGNHSTNHSSIEVPAYTLNREPTNSELTNSEPITTNNNTYDLNHIELKISNTDNKNRHVIGDYPIRKTVRDRQPWTLTGHYTQQTSTGQSVQQTSTGLTTQQTSTGHTAQHTSTGHTAQQTSTGHSVQQTSTGHTAQHTSTGHTSQHTSTGHSAQQTSTGHTAQHTSTGHSGYLPDYISKMMIDINTSFDSMDSGSQI